ncbi:MAG: hypothetical protein RL322_1710 [Pseudomonadota bacterium]|jgi:ribosome-associated protein
MRRSSPLPDEDQTERPSKSQRKRDSHALQDLGEQLVELSDERLLALGVPERLHDAIRLVRTIRAHEGRRRQMQYIGRLMREEVDVDALRGALEEEHSRHRIDTALMHEAERWREQLIAEPDALIRWVDRWPDTRPRIEALVTAARSEVASGTRGRHYRDLYRLLRDTLTAAERAVPPDRDQPPLNA